MSRPRFGRIGRRPGPEAIFAIAVTRPKIPFCELPGQASRPPQRGLQTTAAELGVFANTGVSPLSRYPTVILPVILP